ncbi:MAG TPA: ATP-binding protein, partial [Candidatus Sulfotelmatobacter sp.]|nr:ATP-binding protein [Candidatus Sulfotelmatobacter sp.]
TEFCFEEDRSLGEERIKQNLHGGREEFDFRFRRTDGSELLVLACTSPVTGQDGGVVGALGMFSDITQRKRAEEALRAADRRKDDFLAVLAHELRNPLAPVQNAVHILRARGTGDPTARWAEDVIDRQSRQLARLVDDLLDLSRIRRGRLTLQMARVDLRQPAAQAIETSRPLIQARKHTLELSIGAEPIPVHGDPARLAQVILNLLNNAAKYTPEGGQIWLGLSVEDGRAVVRVRDSGVGIEAETLARIFDLFERGNVPSTEQEGLGIGLTIVRRLVEMHGGHVTATSPGRGQGSEFVVRLPLTAEPLSHPEAPREPPAVGDAVRRRVLVVDDNQDSAESTALLLEHWGHEVEMAHDAAGALAVAAQRPFEIVLLDIGLPGMSGYELARELRAVPGLERVCLVALTGYGQEEDRRRSREAGFDHHLIKPVDWRALQRLLGECGPSDPAQAP